MFTCNRLLSVWCILVIVCDHLYNVRCMAPGKGRTYLFVVATIDIDVLLKMQTIFSFENSDNQIRIYTDNIYLWLQLLLLSECTPFYLFFFMITSCCLSSQMCFHCFLRQMFLWLLTPILKLINWSVVLWLKLTVTPVFSD